jgi:hypothetical protein
MSVEAEVAANSTSLVAGLTAAVTAGGLALMSVVRQYMSNRKDNAADKSAASTYDMLVSENRRMQEQMTNMSLLINKSLSEKMDFMLRINELERRVAGMDDVVKENAELRAKVTQVLQENVDIRAENHDLRDKMSSLESKMAQQ